MSLGWFWALSLFPFCHVFPRFVQGFEEKKDARVEKRNGDRGSENDSRGRAGAAGSFLLLFCAIRGAMSSQEKGHHRWGGANSMV